MMESVHAGSLCGVGDATHQVSRPRRVEGEVWPAGDLMANESMLDQPTLTDSRRSSDHDRAAGLAQPALKRTHFLLAAHKLGLGRLEGKVILLLFLLGLVLLGSAATSTTGSAATSPWRGTSDPRSSGVACSSAS